MDSEVLVKDCHDLTNSNKKHSSPELLRNHPTHRKDLQRAPLVGATGFEVVLSHQTNPGLIYHHTMTGASRQSPQSNSSGKRHQFLKLFSENFPEPGGLPVPGRRPGRMASPSVSGIVLESFPESERRGILESFPADFPEGFPEGCPEGFLEPFPECLPESYPASFPEPFLEGLSEGFPECLPESGRLLGKLPGRLPGRLPGNVAGRFPGKLPGMPPGRLPGTLAGRLIGRFAGVLPETIRNILYYNIPCGFLIL
jgi:hypothetical protein